MSRKTSAQMQALLDNHENLTRYWATKKENANGELVSDVFREGMLTGLNTMLEVALMNAKCYHGYRYVKFERLTDLTPAGGHVSGEWVTLNNFTPMEHPTIPGRVIGKELSSLEEQTRQYFSKV